MDKDATLLRFFFFANLQNFSSRVSKDQDGAEGKTMAGLGKMSRNRFEAGLLATLKKATTGGAGWPPTLTSGLRGCGAELGTERAKAARGYSTSKCL